MAKINLLVNLPPGFFTNAALTPIFQELEAFADVRKTSCNAGAEILGPLQEADAVLMWSWPRLTSEILAQCPKLKFSANLDLTQEGARTLLAHGIPCSVGRRAFSPAVAEMALLLTLSALRKTPDHQAAMRAGTETWVKAFPDDIDPDERELTGRKVGLVGFGGVGQRLAALLAPFACDVKIHDPFLPDEVAARFGVENVSMASLAAHADILVLCAAANAGTRSLLEARHIESLKPGAVLVNVARASLVANDALIARLRRGDLYAALDVFDQEPLPADSVWRSLPNVYLTPHRAGGVMASVERILRYLSDDLRAFFAGQERRHALTETMIAALDA